MYLFFRVIFFIKKAQKLKLYLFYSRCNSDYGALDSQELLVNRQVYSFEHRWSRRSGFVLGTLGEEVDSQENFINSRIII